MGGRPPSRSATMTPGKAGLTNPSPSMANRQIPGSVSDPLMNEINSMPVQMVNAIKQEVGLADKDINLLTLDDKVGRFLR